MLSQFNNSLLQCNYLLIRRGGRLQSTTPYFGLLLNSVNLYT